MDVRNLSNCISLGAKQVAVKLAVLKGHDFSRAAEAA
jgi:thiamine monophosphate synthase